MAGYADADADPFRDFRSAIPRLSTSWTAELGWAFALFAIGTDSGNVIIEMLAVRYFPKHRVQYFVNPALINGQTPNGARSWDMFIGSKRRGRARFASR